MSPTNLPINPMDHRVEADRGMRFRLADGGDITPTEHLLAAIHDLLDARLPKPAHRAPCVAGERCGEAAHCPPADADPATVPTRIGDTAMAVADALEDAARQVDDDKARQTLVRLADEWRAEADEYPEPETVTVTLPRDVVDLALGRLDKAACWAGDDGQAAAARGHMEAWRALADALDAASATQSERAL